MKKTNIIIILCISVVAILVSFFGSGDRDLYKYLIIYSIIPVMLLPYIIEYIFKIKINEPIIFIYLIFVILAHFFGTILDFYKQFYMYDKIVHTLSGVMSSFLALVILHKLKMYNKKNLLFNIIFIIAIALAIASLWEIYEFTFDNIFGKDAQRVLKTGVGDTMTDIIVALIGSFWVSLMYLYEGVKNKKLLVISFISKI